MLGFPKCQRSFPFLSADVHLPIDDFLGEVDALLRRSWPEALDIQMDVQDEEDKIIVQADVPGISKDELDVSLEGDCLTISSQRESCREEEKAGYFLQERSCGKFSRTIRLPSEVLEDSVEATLKGGVLRLVLKKSQAAQLRKIKIQEAR